MTFDSLAERVAKEFRVQMEDEGFETFSEMVKCYMWETSDIRNEVSSILKDVGDDAYVDEEDGNFVYLNGESISYSRFSKMFRNYLKSYTKEN